MLGDGIEVMVGGRGNDLYYVNHEYDSVREELGEGVDVVRSRIADELCEQFAEMI